MQSVAASWARLGQLFQTLVVLRAPLVAALIGIGVMNASQLQEVVTVFMDDHLPLTEINHFTFALVSIFLCSAVIWFVARSFSLNAPLHRPAPLAPPPVARSGWAAIRWSIHADKDAVVRSKAFFLAVTPVAIAAGYLTYGYWSIYRHIPADTAGIVTAAVLAILIPAALAFVVSVAMLVVCIGVGAWVDGTLDASLTRTFFGRAEEESSTPIASDDYIGAYLELMRLIIRTIKRLAGGVRDDTALAQTYGLADRRSSFGWPVKPSAAAASPVVLGRPAESAPMIDWRAAGRALGATQFVLLNVAAMLTLAIPGLLILVSLSFLTQWGNWAETFGSVTIVQIFITWLAIVLTALHWRPNLAAAIAVALIACAWFDLNDTHHIRRLSGARPAQTAQSSLADGFSTWLDHRRDAKVNQRYPVYVVAARGGGIYAAYHAAIFLSRLQDSCPAFTEHLFAISSVSGGSLGAGMFSALTSTSPRAALGPCGEPTNKPGSMEQRARAIVGNDFLSPAVSAALFSDLVMQAVPACITNRWSALCLEGRDRAWALEASFERAFSGSARADGSTRNPLTESFYSQWSETGAVPALLINTTVVETGSRLVVAPFSSFDGPSDAPSGRSVSTLLNTAGDLDIRLSTAIGLSARFPVISPAAWYRARQPDGAFAKIRLVDGGYFDNSGVATALDAIEVMQRVAARKARALDIRLLVLTGSASPSEASYSFSEVLSVGRALLNTRAEHGRRIEELAHARVTDAAAPVAVSMLSAVLDTVGHQLPLGWQLSKESRRVIEHHSGSLTNTQTCLSLQPQAAKLTPVEVSSCTMALVSRDLASSAEPSSIPTLVPAVR